MHTTASPTRFSAVAHETAAAIAIVTLFLTAIWL